LSTSSSISRKDGFRKRDCRCIRFSAETLGRSALRGGGESGVTASDCARDDTEDVRDFVRRGGGGRLIKTGGDGGSGVRVG